MKITYYGQSCILLELDKVKFLFDPFISGNPLAQHIDIDSIKADFILVTHGHQDHILDLERVAKNNPEATFISNFEIVNKFEHLGLKNHSMNIGGKYEFEFGFVKMVNALHSSSFPDGTYAGNPCGFVIWDYKSSVYVAGDTALTEDMKLIPKTCPDLDVAVLPIGDNYTMGYKDAVVASKYLECGTVFACHYDTFPVIEVDKLDVLNHSSHHNVHIIVKEVGETWELN